MQPTESIAPQPARTVPALPPSKQDPRLNWGDVDELPDIEPEHFHRDYLQKNRPVVVRQAFGHWPAISRWTDDYLKRTIGFGRVEVATSPDKFAGRPFRDLQDVEMSFSEFIDRLYSPEGRYDYVVDRLRPSLFRDIGPHALFDAMGPLFRRMLFMGGGGNRIALHTDWYHNLVAQIAGAKRFILCSPVDALWLRPLTDQINFSALDVRNPDLNAYPQASRATFFEGAIYPGDLLYIPPMWWHAVESYDRNMMVSSAFAEGDSVLLGIVARLLDSGQHTISSADAEAVRAILASERPLVRDLARLARERSLVDIQRVVRHRTTFLRG